MTTVLVVEDNEQNLGLMRYLLRAAGFDIAEARNGLEGIAFARSSRPDLILMDLQMPQLDGFGALAGIRADAELAHIPIVAVTAYSMAGDRERALAAGFDGYLSKPIDPWTFVESVKEHLVA